MIDNRDFILLYMEPKKQKSEEPTIDELTRKMTVAYRDSFSGLVYGDLDRWGQPALHHIQSMGWHTCVCGARGGTEHLLREESKGLHIMTNALCIHYLAWHRDEVPEKDLEIVRSFQCGEAKPTQEELQ